MEQWLTGVEAVFAHALPPSVTAKPASTLIDNHYATPPADHTAQR
jgi:hypothetical protein